MAWIRAVGRSPAATMTGGDVVHTDFHPGNILVDDDGNITGIVDWDGAGRGDRRLGVVTLAFDLGWGMRFDPRYTGVTTAGLAILRRRLVAMELDVLRAYWAHMGLRLVDWSIRHYSPEVVDHYLDFAATSFDGEGGANQAGAFALG